jgi:hypothetical protein
MIAKLWSIPVPLQCAVMRKFRMLAVGQYLKCRKLIQTQYYSRVYLMDNGLEVAKAMIQAGIQAAAMIAEQGEMEIETSLEAPRILH